MILNSSSLKAGLRSARKNWRVFAYTHIHQRAPWSHGYREYKWNAIQKVISNKSILSRFVEKEKLPKCFGYGLDERIIEYPWALAALQEHGGKKLLDIGSTLNHKEIILHEYLRGKEITCANIIPEQTCLYEHGVSYLLTDTRDTPYKDEVFDIITCISTLEHIGMDNNYLYGDDPKNIEKDSGSYRNALREMVRILNRGGLLLVTVPFGKYEDHAYFQQFDRAMVQEITSRYNADVTYYRYLDTGWQLEPHVETLDATPYYDVHKMRAPGAGANMRQAAAGAVACISIRKQHHA